MDCWEVTGTWVNIKSAVVSPTKKKVVKQDSSRPRKKARKEASEEASEEAAAVAKDINTMFKDIVDAMREGFGTCLKDIKYLSKRMEVVEKKESVNGTIAGRKSLPEDKGPNVPADASSSKDKAPEPSLEDARYLEKRDAALALCRAKSDRTRKLAASQQSPSAANNTAKVIIPNKKLYPGYNLFALIDKKELKELADWLKTCPHYRTPLDKKPRTSRTWWYQILRTSLEWLKDYHIDAWINVLRKSYDANPQHFRSERMCFIDHLFAQQWRFNNKDFKDSEPDQNGLGRRLPDGAWNYYTGTIPSFFQSNKVWGTDIDNVYASVNYNDTHWIAMWISIPKRHIVVWDIICSSISPEELDVVMEHFLYMVPYLLVECASSDEQRAQYSLEPFTYERPTNIPPARAGDCGVYSLKYIECHALGIKFSKKDFTKPNGKTMRDKMAVDIFQEHPDAHEFENKDNDAGRLT
uniref:Ubiquitin-like protease family profile domain-containing protein n=1 Tax=Brassica oleracea var. oleracea TaxID=109376 RepID=A0A0D3EEM9_BRAOL